MGFVFPKPIIVKSVIVGAHFDKLASEDDIVLIMEMLYTRAGYSASERKEFSLTTHGFHAASDNIATVLMWPSDERTEMGRWAYVVDYSGVRRKQKSGPQSIMHARYASEASAANQMRLRARLIRAVTYLVGNEDQWKSLPHTPSLSPLTQGDRDIYTCDEYGPCGVSSTPKSSLQSDDYFPSRLPSI